MAAFFFIRAMFVSRGRVGKLRLMYECNPMAMLMEQAGGAATDGEKRIMIIEPNALHQRVGLIMGDPVEVQTISRACAGKARGGRYAVYGAITRRNSKLTDRRSVWDKRHGRSFYLNAVKLDPGVDQYG